MDDATLVRGVERVGDLSRDREHVVDRQREPPRHRLYGKPVRQRASVDELEHQRADAVTLFDPVDLRRYRDDSARRAHGLRARSEPAGRDGR